MMERYMKSEAPPGEEFYQWDNELTIQRLDHVQRNS